MRRTVSNLSEYTAVVWQDEKKYLAIRTGLRSKIFAVNNLAELKSESGWIWNKERMIPWEIKGFAEDNNEMYIYGDWIEGIPLPDFLEDSSRDLKEILPLFIDYFQDCSLKNIPLNRFCSSNYLVLPEDSLLSFPPRIMNHILKCKTESEKMKLYEPFNHPDLAEKDNALFTTGVLSYKAALGVYPFTCQTNSEEIHEEIRKYRILSPKERKPSLKIEISRTIMTALTQTNDSKISMDDFKEILTQRDWKKEITKEENDAILALAAKKAIKESKRFKRDTMIRKYKIQMIIGLAALVSIIFVTVGLLTVDPSPLIGLTEIEVVETYYQRLSDLDVSAEECTDGEMSIDDIEEITNFYVISKVRMGYEGTTGFIPAQIWRDGGSPQVNFPESVYGIANLQIDSIGNGQIKAIYEKWLPGETEMTTNEGDPASYFGYQNTDIISMIYNEDGYWVIDEIERSNVPISE